MMALAFFAAVVGVSATQYKNPWIYPILDGGQATALVGGKIGSYPGYGSKVNFLDTMHDGLGPDGRPKIEREPEYRQVGAFAKGAVFKVVGIYGDSGDLYQRVGLVLSDGKLEFQASQEQWAPSPVAVASPPAGAGSPMESMFGQKVQPSKTVQAPWAESLGKLMLWPVFPMLGLAMLAPSAPSAAPTVH